MSFSYSGDPSSSPLDEVRFLYQDTDPGIPLLTNEEVEFLIARWLPKYDSLTYVAAVCAAAVSRKFVGIVTVVADGVSVNVADLTQRYEDMARRLRAEFVASQIGAKVDLTNIMIGQEPDFSIKPLSFSVGMHDNPEAGQQDYGGWVYADPFADVGASPW